MEIKDATAKMTLGAIKTRDIDNLGLLLSNRNAREICFNRKIHALIFLGTIVDVILKDKFSINQAELYKDCGADFQKRIKALSGKPVNPCYSNVPVSDPAMLKLIRSIDKLLAEKDVKVERRQYTALNDRWRSGIYIYHANEIAYFISEPYQRKGGHYSNGHIIVPAFGKWFILTNYSDKSSIQVETSPIAETMA